MRVLVTGGAGYIASHTAKILARNGFEPVVLDNLSAGHEWAVKWGPLITGDIGDIQLVQETLHAYEIQAIIHFAAFTSVGESMSQPGKFFHNNLAKTISLLNAALEHGIRAFVFSSSAAIYGPPETTPVPESHPHRPISPYGESKLMVEQILRWHGELQGLRWAALRYFNASGADPEGEIGEWHDPETHLIPLVIQTALGKRPHLSLYGTDYPTPDGTAIRDYVHVMDLANAHVLALQHLLEDGESFAANLGSGTGHSVREIVETVEQVSGRTVPVIESARRAGDPPALIADAKHACKILGWQPDHPDLNDIIQSAWNWHIGGRQHLESK